MMARDTRGAYERRNARARADGFSSYAQQRRAKIEGYKAPAEYTAAVKARRTDAGIVRAVTKGKLLGTNANRAGRIVAAKGSQLVALEKVLAKLSPRQRFTVAVETKGGDILHLGGRGGYSSAYMATAGGLFALIEAAAAEAYESFSITAADVSVVTVTFA